ncbi:RHS repeat-associated core domain protein-containing protein [Pseudomonas sp. GM78]|uniref:RHS repeat-associated core domain-containing protein n=1 Tax=Pseudomonas sp. GM78 TaxID=1144337 RepID=UPI000270721F|nr:RHS repeat-associated core domain-containing protein [Pseudomonas sp. GM78]EJN30018.1 RHS repeat-associated core domain protein-containing protein [Pseudomonas sp. GM78]
MTLNTTMCRYRYDALDQLTGLDRAGQENLQRFYCRDHLVSELQGGSSQSVLQNGAQLLALQSRELDAVNCQLLTTDPQRSVLQVTEAAGSVQQTYSPYGNRRVEGGSGSLLGFTGEVLDPVTGHYLLGNGHRAFNPLLMRFNSPDSLSPFGRGGLNPYTYCLGDPVNFSDPTGQFGDILRLAQSGLSLWNTGLGMSRVIPSFNLSKDALILGAMKKLSPKQSFAALSTVVASGAILTTSVIGVGSAVAVITEDTEVAAILGYIVLGLTVLAFVSRGGTYWAAKDPGTERALRDFVKNKGQIFPPTPPAASRRASLSPEPSAPPRNQFAPRGKRTYAERFRPEIDRPILKAKRRIATVNSNEEIRQT